MINNNNNAQQNANGHLPPQQQNGNGHLPPQQQQNGNGHLGWTAAASQVSNGWTFGMDYKFNTNINGNSIFAPLLSGLDRTNLKTVNPKTCFDFSTKKNSPVLKQEWSGAAQIL